MLSYTLIAVTLIVVPGPDWAFILAVGARDHVVVPAVGGLMLGYAAITVVVTVGVGPLVADSSTALLALTAWGAAYLIYLGIKVLRSPTDISEADLLDHARTGRIPAGRNVAFLHTGGTGNLFETPAVVGAITL